MQQWDPKLIAIADFVCDAVIDSELAFETAHYCLMDALARGFKALDCPACSNILGPVIPGATLAGGARVPGTSYELEPVMAAFNIGALSGWLEVNDCRLAAEWGHPSDNLGGILAVADYLSRQGRVKGRTPLRMRDVLVAMICAYEIQRVLAADDNFKHSGLDHVGLVRVASTAVVTRMLGGDKDAVLSALSLTWIDGDSLRTDQQAPNTGWRERWEVADATSRAVRLGLLALSGEMGDPSALSAKTRGCDEVLFKGKPFGLQRGYGSEEAARLQQNFVDSVSPKLTANQWDSLNECCADREKLAGTAVDDFMALLVA